MTQKTVIILGGPTGPTGTFKGVNILGSFTGPTGTYPIWSQATGNTGPNGTFESVYNIGPTGPTGTIKTVIIPGFAGGGGAATTWNPLDKDTLVTLSATNHTATITTTGSNSGVRGTTSHAAGKWYLEYSANVIGTFHSHRGFATAAQILTNFDTTHSFGMNEAGGLDTPTGGSLGDPTGHVIGVAIDIGVGKWWVRLDNGAWMGVSTTSDPVAGTNGSDYTSIIPAATAIFPCLMGFSNAGHIVACTINCGDSAFANPAPAGYTKWG